MAGKKSKATEAEIVERVNFVFEALCEGVLSRDMFEYVAKKRPEWDVAERTVQRYVQQANAEFKKLAAKNRDREFGKANARLNTLFLRNLKVQDYKTALAVQKEINSLYGLNEPEKHEVEHSGTMGLTWNETRTYEGGETE